MPFYSRLAFLSAYLIGVLFANFLPVSQQASLEFSLKRVFSFLLFSVFAFSLRSLLLRNFLGKARDHEKNMQVLNLVAATIGTLLSLELFRYYSGPYPFYLLLVVLLLQALKLRYRERANLAFGFNFGADWGLAILSIWSVVGVIGLDSIFVGLALASMLSTLTLLYLTFTRPQIERIYPVLMPIGPLIIGAYPLFGVAPRIYCGILIIIALAQPLVRVLKSGGSLMWIRREATGVCYLFIVMLVLLRLVVSI